PQIPVEASLPNYSLLTYVAHWASAPDVSLRYLRPARLIKTEANQARFSSIAGGWAWNLTNDEGRKTNLTSFVLRLPPRRADGIADNLHLRPTSAPAGPAVPQLRGRPTRWPESAVAGHHYCAHIRRH